MTTDTAAICQNRPNTGIKQFCESFKAYLLYGYVTCCFKTFGRFEMATAVLMPLQGLEMAWLFRNGQLFLLAVLIPHQFDISGQVCSVAFKCNSCNTIKNLYIY